MSKFQLRCSCLICKREITVQSLKMHCKTHDPKSYCPTCNSPIYNTNKFCNSSCAATFNNIGKIRSLESKQKTSTTIYSKIKAGTHIFTRPPFTPINFCIICNTLIRGSRKTCSDDCKKVHHSVHMANLIYNGYNPNKNRGRGKQSYLERSFEEWIKLTVPHVEYHTEYPFKRLDMIKTYFADFYFPQLKLIIELDGTQHNNPKQQKYDKERDQYISQQYNLTIVRISHKEYITKTKIQEIHHLLERPVGLEPT